ncbi:cell surface glycoprotein 1-like, partial [Adelges cooleyi]|uniref:cell surface glycoprotein 1-like n=1 Tax=Adelges cooleyi TaxID=133065 RepID=UPI0021808852
IFHDRNDCRTQLSRVSSECVDHTFIWPRWFATPIKPETSTFKIPLFKPTSTVKYGTGTSTSGSWPPPHNEKPTSGPSWVTDDISSSPNNGGKFTQSSSSPYWSPTYNFFPTTMKPRTSTGKIPPVDVTTPTNSKPNESTMKLTTPSTPNNGGKFTQSSSSPHWSPTNIFFPTTMKPRTSTGKRPPVYITFPTDSESNKGTEKPTTPNKYGTGTFLSSSWPPLYTKKPSNIKDLLSISPGNALPTKPNSTKKPLWIPPHPFWFRPTSEPSMTTDDSDGEFTEPPNLPAWPPTFWPQPTSEAPTSTDDSDGESTEPPNLPHWPPTFWPQPTSEPSTTTDDSDGEFTEPPNLPAWPPTFWPQPSSEPSTTTDDSEGEFTESSNLPPWNPTFWPQPTSEPSTTTDDSDGEFTEPSNLPAWPPTFWPQPTSEPSTTTDDSDGESTEPPNLPAWPPTFWPQPTSEPSTTTDDSDGESTEPSNLPAWPPTFWPQPTSEPSTTTDDSDGESTEPSNLPAWPPTFWPQSTSEPSTTTDDSDGESTEPSNLPPWPQSTSKPPLHTKTPRNIWPIPSGNWAPPNSVWPPSIDKSLKFQPLWILRPWRPSNLNNKKPCRTRCKKLLCTKLKKQLKNRKASKNDKLV